MSIKHLINFLSALAVLSLPVSVSPSKDFEAQPSKDRILYGALCYPGGWAGVSDMKPPRGVETGLSFTGMPLEMDPRWEIIEERLRPFFGDVVDTILVSGNTRTKRITIVREMATKKGDILEDELIYRDTNYLRGLGFFSDVDISAERSSHGRCGVHVHIEERPGLFMKYPYPVVNYDIKKGVSYGFKWKVKNFRGVGEELSFSVIKRRDRDHGGNISWNVPWVYGRRLRLQINLFTYRRLEEPESDDFIKNRNGGQVAVGLPLSRDLVRQVWLNTLLSLEGRDSRLSTAGGGGLGEYYRQNLLSIGLGMHYDSRDNRIDARRGVFARLHARRFSSVHGLDQQYIFYNFSSYFYLPIGKEGTVILAIDSDIREGDLPSFFEMGLGGTGDLRGYSNEDLEGTAKVIGTVQLRRRLFGPRIFNIPHIGKFDITINGVVFVDNGALMDSIEKIGSSVYNTTAGLGIEVLSPIQDLVRFEVAMDGEGRPVIYMASGVRF